ncbi:YgcG family protein [Fontimonas sp. SYSU GA230001]|uniref:TPM domain-containing protein n=1 Tax=Fontimonas sp. SYSU GA230001 TaxID=3142450 RepID=UPI0032B4682A
MRAAALLAGFLALAAAVWAEVAIPPVARVTDLTGTLTAAQQRELTQRLIMFEQAKGSQLAVLIVPTTQPETVEQYALRVAEAWKLGRKGIDDGVLLLVAKDDRALRIEVGYGLEGALPDAIAKRIIAETITPSFRDGDFYGGIAAGVGQIIAVINGEPLPEPAADHQAELDREGNLVAGLVVVGSIGLLLRGVLGLFPAALLVAVIVFLGGWAYMGDYKLPLFLAVAGFFMTLTSGRGGGVGGIRSGGGGFGGGGGGFRGGGGGFGGGGASGRW